MKEITKEELQKEINDLRQKLKEQHEVNVGHLKIQGIFIAAGFITEKQVDLAWDLVDPKTS